MRAKEWVVEEYEVSEISETRPVYTQHFADCASMVVHIRTRTLALRGSARLRVHIPDNATMAERRSIRDAGGTVL
jgi:hypothetical protein